MLVDELRLLAPADECTGGVSSVLEESSILSLSEAEESRAEAILVLPLPATDGKLVNLLLSYK